MSPSERIRVLASRLSVAPLTRLKLIESRLTAVVRYLDEQYAQGSGINGPTAEALTSRTQNLNERLKKLEDKEKP